MEIFKDFDRIIILDHEEEEYDKMLFYLFSPLDISGDASPELSLI